MATQTNPLRRIPPPPPGFTEIVTSQIPPPPPGFTEEVTSTAAPLSLRESINESLAPRQFTETGEPTTAGGKAFEQAERMTSSPMVAEFARRVTDFNPFANPKESLKAAARAPMGVINMGAEALRPPQTPEEMAVAAQGGQGGLAIKRLLLDPRVRGYEDMKAAIAKGDMGAAMRAANQAFVPVAGDLMRGIGEAEEKTGLGAVAVEQVTGAALPKLVKPAARAGMAAARGTTALARTTGTTLAGAGRSAIAIFKAPVAERAMQQALQPSVTIPKATESIGIAGPELQRVRVQRGVEIRDTGDKGAAMKAHAENVVETKRAIWKELEQRTIPYETFYEKTHDVGRAMRDAVDGRIRSQYPEVAAKIDKRAGTYNKMMSLRQIEENIQSANNELSNWYKKSAADPGSVAPNIAATVAEVQTLRKLLDRKIHSFTGEHVSDFKRIYGALRDVERATARQMFVQARQKGATLYEALAGLSAVGDIIGGTPWGAFKAAGRLAVGKRLAQLRNADYLIEQAYHGKGRFQEAPPRPGYTAPPMMQPPPATGAPKPAGLLPGTTYTGTVVPPAPPTPQVAGAPSSPRATLPPYQTPQMGPGRTIPVGPAQSARPQPLTETPARVDVSKTSGAGSWPKQMSIQEIRGEASILRKKAASIRSNAAKMRDTQKAQRWGDQADSFEAKAKQLEAAAEQRMQPQTESAKAKAEPKTEVSQEEHAIFSLLPARFGGAGLLSDEIITQTGMSAQQVASTISQLEAKGLVTKKMGGRFVANVAPDSVAAKVKAIWEMTREEYGATLSGRAAEGYASTHQAIVRNAMKRGDPVPEKVKLEFEKSQAPPAIESAKATYESLTLQESPRVQYMIDLWKQMDSRGRSSLDDALGLKRGTWKGLSIEEKIARAFRERDGKDFPTPEEARAAIREPGADEEVPATPRRTRQIEDAFGAAREIGEIARTAREEQTAFLKAKGLTWEEVRSWPKEKQEALQAEWTKTIAMAEGKSKNHLAVIDGQEYFIGNDGNLYRATISNPLDRGFRAGARFEATAAAIPLWKKLNLK